MNLRFRVKSIKFLGQEMYEDAKYGRENGQLIAATIDDARFQTQAVIQNITIHVADSLSRQGEPIKGIGEAPTACVPPAVIRALEKTIRKRLRKTPLLPEDIRTFIKTYLFRIACFFSDSVDSFARLKCLQRTWSLHLKQS